MYRPLTQVNADDYPPTYQCPDCGETMVIKRFSADSSDWRFYAGGLWVSVHQCPKCKNVEVVVD